VAQSQDGATTEKGLNDSYADILQNSSKKVINTGAGRKQSLEIGMLQKPNTMISESPTLTAEEPLTATRG